MTDYNEIFKEISKGDPEAYDFCRTFFEWSHTIDDLIDRDKVVPTDIWINACIKLLDMASRNRFFRKHREPLLAVIRTSALAYMASEEYKKHAIKEQVIAEVLKSQYQDVFFEVAFWVGGFKWQMEIATKYRGYAFN